MKIGIFRGTSDDTTNQYHERLFLGWGICLSNYELDAFGRADFPASAGKYYNIVETNPRSYQNPFTKIISVYRQTIEYIRRHSPDVLIQVRNFATHATGVVLAGRTAGIPVIIRYPSDAFNEFRNVSGLEKIGVFSLQNICGRVPVQLAQKAIVLGPHGQKLLVNRGMSYEDIVIIPPPRGMTGRFCPVNDMKEYRSNLKLPPDERVVLFVGRLTRMKGMEFARSVIQRTSSNSDVTYVFVGEGPYKEKLRDEFDDNILRMPGHVPYSKIDKYYKSADVYMHPSPHEGIPLSILEALDCEVPVVAREAGDIGFVTSNTVTTPEQMAELILTDNLEPIWLNKNKFTVTYQREKLNEAILSIID